MTSPPPMKPSEAIFDRQPSEVIPIVIIEPTPGVYRTPTENLSCATTPFSSRLGILSTRRLPWERNRRLMVPAQPKTAQSATTKGSAAKSEETKVNVDTCNRVETATRQISKLRIFKMAAQYSLLQLSLFDYSTSSSRCPRIIVGVVPDLIKTLFSFFFFYFDNDCSTVPSAKEGHCRPGVQYNLGHFPNG